MGRVQDKLVWIDCEMTGLDTTSDKLIEIAALVTDGDLNILGDGVDIVIHADDEALANMPDVVTKMHAASGLTDEVRASTVTLAQAEQQVLDYIRAHVTSSGQVPLAGDSLSPPPSLPPPPQPPPPPDTPSPLVARRSIPLAHTTRPSPPVAS